MDDTRGRHRVTVVELRESGIRLAVVEGSEIERLDSHPPPPPGRGLGVAIAGALEAESHGSELVAVVAAGMVDDREGSLVSSLPTGRWTDVPIVADIEARLPARAVVHRFSDATAVGEARLGAAQAEGHVLVMFIDDYDVHAGTLRDGDVVPVFRGSFGQMILDPDETRCSEAGVAGALAAHVSLSGMMQTRQTLLLDSAGQEAIHDAVDTITQAIVRLAAGSLFPGIRMMFDQIVICGDDPQLLEVIVGGVGPALAERVSPAPDVAQGHLGSLAPILGAACFA
jgi:predicted NBD/HSP70 family sugar kinase